MLEVDASLCCLASDTVKGENVVSLSQSVVWVGGTVHHGFVVTEHVACVIHLDTQVSKGGSEIHDLFDACPCSNELCTMCCCF